MLLIVFIDFVEVMGIDQFKSYCDYVEGLCGDCELEIDMVKFDVDGLNDLLVVVKVVGDIKIVCVVEFIFFVWFGCFDKLVVNFKVFKGVLEVFLKVDMIDGWIYVMGDDGKLYLQFVIVVIYDDGMSYGCGKLNFIVCIYIISYGFVFDGNYKLYFGVNEKVYGFYLQIVVNWWVVDILVVEGIYKEMVVLCEVYFKLLECYCEVM